MAGSGKAEVKKGSLIDRLKWLLVIALIAIAVVGNQYFSDFSLLYRVLAIVVIGFFAGFIAISTAKGGDFWQLMKGARLEVRKIIWPTKQETTQTTIVVVIFVLISGLVLWGVDTFLGWLILKEILGV